jgi:hypothetical protein
MTELRGLKHNIYITALRQSRAMLGAPKKDGRRHLRQRPI